MLFEIINFSSVVNTIGIILLKISFMVKELKADDILPFIIKLSLEERHRLLRLILKQGLGDGQAYARKPPRDDEFLSNEDNLLWDAEGWEDIGSFV